MGDTYEANFELDNYAGEIDLNMPGEGDQFDDTLRIERTDGNVIVDIRGRFNHSAAREVYDTFLKGEIPIAESLVNIIDDGQVQFLDRFEVKLRDDWSVSVSSSDTNHDITVTATGPDGARSTQTLHEYSGDEVKAAIVQGLQGMGMGGP